MWLLGCTSILDARDDVGGHCCWVISSYRFRPRRRLHCVHMAANVHRSSISVPVVIIARVGAGIVCNLWERRPVPAVVSLHPWLHRQLRKSDDPLREEERASMASATSVRAQARALERMAAQGTSDPIPRLRVKYHRQSTQRLRQHGCIGWDGALKG